MCDTSGPAPRSRGGCVAINPETSPRPRCWARAQPPSAAPGLRLLGDSSSQSSPHSSRSSAPAPAQTLPWLGTHPAAPAPVEAGLRAAGPEALLNIAADLLTSLPGRQRRVSTHFFHLWFPGFLRKGEAVGGSNRHPRARATAPSSLSFPGRGGCQRGPLSRETAAWLGALVLVAQHSTTLLG